MRKKEKKSEKVFEIVCFAVGLAMGVVTLIFAFTGRPGSYIAEPLLATGVIAIAIAELSRQ